MSLYRRESNYNNDFFLHIATSAVDLGVFPGRKKSSYFYQLFCVHSFTSQDVKVDQGVHIFFSFLTYIHRVKQGYESMLKNS